MAGGRVLVRQRTDLGRRVRRLEIVSLFAVFMLSLWFYRDALLLFVCDRGGSGTAGTVASVGRRLAKRIRTALHSCPCASTATVVHAAATRIAPRATRCAGRTAAAA
eukprot:3917727-Rhodomonas_salina.1